MSGYGTQHQFIGENWCLDEKWGGKWLSKFIVLIAAVAPV